MLFLEDFNLLDKYIANDQYSEAVLEQPVRAFYWNDTLEVSHFWEDVHRKWRSFQEEELGRVLSDEFEFFVSDWTIDEIKKQTVHAVETCLWGSMWNKCKNKIKITIVKE